MEEPRACVVCGRTESTAPCTVCREPVCPDHRVGSGRLEDGYTCMSDSRRCFVRREQLLTAELTKAIEGGLLQGTPRLAVASLRRRMPVYQLAVTVLGGTAGAWLDTPNETLGGVTPMSLLETEAGVETVLDELRRIQHDGTPG